MTVPALHIGGWYDIFLGGTLRNYLGMRAQGATPKPGRARNCSSVPGNTAPPEGLASLGTTTSGIVKLLTLLPDS